MNVKQRIRAIMLSDNIKKNPGFAKELGVDVKLKAKNKEKEILK